MITVNIGGGTTPIQVNWTAGMNAQQAMEEAYVVSTQAFNFALQYFGQAGYMVIMINQTYETFQTMVNPYFYWDFILNGIPSSQGISETILNDGDVISFDLTIYNSEKHSNTMLEVKHKAKMAALTLN
jgi:hypothetical protein